MKNAEIASIAQMQLAVHKDDPDEVGQRRVRPQRRVIPAAR
jgi:hypothetical protein